MDSEEAEKYIQMVKEQQERGLQKLKGIRRGTEAGAGGFIYKLDPYSLLSGDYVEHKKVGIGRFAGIKFDVPKDSSQPLEYVFIEYADQQMAWPSFPSNRPHLCSTDTICTRLPSLAFYFNELIYANNIDRWSVDLM